MAMNSGRVISEQTGQPRRAYRSSLRTQQAVATRRRLLTAAGECFAEKGYAGTSLKAIAERAGVSVETVQQGGPKADLLLASYEQTFVGEEGRRSLLDRDAVRPILTRPDVPSFIAAMIDFMVPANIASARLAAAIEAAALSDERIADVLHGLGERARADAKAATALAASLGGVSSGRPIDEVGDELWFVMKPTHHLAFREAGWTAERYRAWLARSSEGLLL